MSEDLRGRYRGSYETARRPSQRYSPSPAAVPLTTKPSPTPAKQQPKRLWRRLLIGLLILVALAGVGFGSFWLWQQHQDSKNPFPRGVRKGITFPLYYPYTLPAGYSVDRNSFQQKDGVVIFSINAPSNRNIAVSEQALPVPAPTHPKDSSPVPLPSTTEKNYSLSIGAAHIGFWGDRYVSDIITSRSWVILNVTHFTADEAVTVTQYFKPVN